MNFVLLEVTPTPRLFQDLSLSYGGVAEDLIFRDGPVFSDISKNRGVFISKG